MSRSQQRLQVQCVACERHGTTRTMRISDAGSWVCTDHEACLQDVLRINKIKYATEGGT